MRAARRTPARACRPAHARTHARATTRPATPPARAVASTLRWKSTVCCCSAPTTSWTHSCWRGRCWWRATSAPRCVSTTCESSWTTWRCRCLCACACAARGEGGGGGATGRRTTRAGGEGAGAWRPLPPPAPPLEQVEAHLPAERYPVRVLRTISEHLYARRGFRGNKESYYEVDNSCIDRVLDTRLGIPITLALVYAEVAARLGVPMVGLNIPGVSVWQLVGGWGAGRPARARHPPPPSRAAPLRQATFSSRPPTPSSSSWWLFLKVGGWAGRCVWGGVVCVAGRRLSAARLGSATTPRARRGRGVLPGGCRGNAAAHLPPPRAPGPGICARQAPSARAHLPGAHAQQPEAGGWGWVGGWVWGGGCVWGGCVPAAHSESWMQALRRMLGLPSPLRSTARCTRTMPARC